MLLAVVLTQLYSLQEMDAGQFSVTDPEDLGGGLENIGFEQKEAESVAATDEKEADDSLFVRQLLSGEDIANPEDAEDQFQAQVFGFAKQMVNFQYLVGDKQTNEVVIIDGAWDPAGIQKVVTGLGMNLTAFVATHFHWDHIGGTVPYDPFKSSGKRLPGMKEFISNYKIPAYVPKLEAAKAQIQCGLEKTSVGAADSDAMIRGYDDGFKLKVGRNTLRFLHTPGHSAGSMVIVVADAAGVDRFVISGDTIFPGSCGRIDLPDSDKAAMYNSLQNVVAALPDSLVVYPGHGYNGKTTTIGQEKRNGLLRPTTKAEWKRQMG